MSNLFRFGKHLTSESQVMKKKSFTDVLSGYDNQPQFFTQQSIINSTVNRAMLFFQVEIYLRRAENQFALRYVFLVIIFSGQITVRQFDIESRNCLFI